MDSTEPQRHLTALIRVAPRNNHVSESNQFAPLLNEFVQRNGLNREDATNLLNEGGLLDFAWQPAWRELRSEPRCGRARQVIA